MINDKGLKETIKEYDVSNESYKAILYVCLEGGVPDVMVATDTDMLASNVIKGLIAVGGAIVGGPIGAASAAGGASGALSNDFAIMTVHDDYFCFYILNKFSNKLIITSRIILPYEVIFKLKIGKFLVWNNLKIRFTINREKYKLKVVISDKTIGLKEQKENIEILLDFLNYEL